MTTPAQDRAALILSRLRPQPDLKKLVREPYTRCMVWVHPDGRRLFFRVRFDGPKPFLAMLIRSPDGTGETLKVPRVRVPVKEDDGFDWDQ